MRMEFPRICTLPSSLFAHGACSWWADSAVVMTEARCSFGIKHFAKTHDRPLKMEQRQFSFRRVFACAASPHPWLVGSSPRCYSPQHCTLVNFAQQAKLQPTTSAIVPRIRPSSASTVKCLSIKEAAGQDLGVVRDPNISFCCSCAGLSCPMRATLGRCSHLFRTSRSQSLSFCTRLT